MNAPKANPQILLGVYWLEHFVMVSGAGLATLLLLQFVEAGLSTEIAFFYSLISGQAASR